MSRRLIAIVLIAVAVVAVIALIYRSGSTAGTAAVKVEAAAQRADRIAESRVDERTAAATTAAIAARTVRADQLADEAVRTTILEIRNALDAVPPAAAGDPLPAAPVDRLREQLNAGIDRANRSAGAAAAGD